MSEQRIVPHDPGAEVALLGAALLRPIIVGDFADIVDPSDFHKPFHQQVWAVMCDLHQAGQPIDPVTVTSALGALGDPAAMASLLAETPSTSAAPSYVRAVVETSRRRKLLFHFAELTDRVYAGESADDIFGDIVPTEASLIGRRGDAIPDLMRLDEFARLATTAERSEPFIIPHIAKPRWRTIIVAGEGVGKATLMRWLGLHVAAGRDPWNPAKLIFPQRVLYVDCENGMETIYHQVRLANLNINLVEEAGENWFVLDRESGMDLRQRRTQAEFERILQQVKPDIVCAGPLYKMFRRGSREDMEQATIEFLEVLDDYRKRYNFALFLEAHAPKGSGGGLREMNPFGSSALLRWPEIGLALEVYGNPLPHEENIVCDVNRFRRDRVPNDWPQQIQRGATGQKVAWTGRWARGRNAAQFPY